MSTEPNTELESLIDRAEGGDAKAIGNFYLEFLKGPLWVPNRHQQTTPNNLADYPNDFIPVLALKKDERTIVPAFTRPELAESWGKEKLICTISSGDELSSRLPDDWWIAIVSVDDLYKEISPWEIRLLIEEGEKAIPAIAEELAIISGEKRPFELNAVSESEYGELRSILTTTLSANSQVSRAYLLKESSLDEDGEEIQTLIIGIEMTSKDPAITRRTEQEITNAAEKLLIGDIFKVRAATLGDEFLPGLFSHFTPFYQRRRGGFISSVRRLFGV